MPATLYASGPEAGLPANVVLKIQLSIVDDAKRQDQGNSPMAVAAPHDAPSERPSPEMAAPTTFEADSAWPEIWDGRPAGSSWPVAPDTLQAATMAPTRDAWPEADREVYAPPVGLAAPELGALAVATTPAPELTAPRVTTINEPQPDLWFLSAESAETAETDTESGEKPARSLLTVGLTVGMAILVILLVLVFIQLMTSLLR
jgi:hypothetical protein